MFATRFVTAGYMHLTSDTATLRNHLENQDICGMKLNFSVAQQPNWVVVASLFKFLDYTQLNTHIHTLGRNPVTVQSASQESIYLCST